MAYHQDLSVSHIHTNIKIMLNDDFAYVAELSANLWACKVLYIMYKCKVLAIAHVLDKSRVKWIWFLNSLNDLPYVYYNH